MTFRILTSTHLERLLDALVDELDQHPQADPFAAETVIVQSGGMRRWLRLRLADRLGIAAGLYLPSTGAFCHDLCADPTATGHDDELDDLTWWLFTALAHPQDLPGSEDELALLQGYLASDDRQTRRYGLAGRLAQAFDDYQLYRPDLLAGWLSAPPRSAGLPHESWQAALWAGYCNARPGEPTCVRLLRLRDALRVGRAVDLTGLPSRLAVFGVATLPPLFIDLLRGLGETEGMTVTVYSLSPTDAASYWFEEAGDRERRAAERVGDDDGFHLPGDGSNDLLLAWGRQGHDFARLLAGVDDTGGVTDDLDAIGVTWLPQDAGTADTSLLRAVQDGIRRLDDRVEPEILADRDASLTVHRCHSRQREVEVLRDSLLDALDHEADLRPHDILVAVPDIEVYAPYIDAVFGVDHPDGLRLPYTVSDRAATARFSLITAFLNLLDLTGSRRGLGEILGMLECAAVRRRYGIDEDEVESLATGLHAAGVRWGADADHRDRLCGYRNEDNTWRQGWRRLMLGYACGPTEDAVVGLLPAGGDTVADADLFGRFGACRETIFAFLDAASGARDGAAWRVLLGRILAECFAPEGDEEQHAHLLVAEAIAALPEGEEPLGLDLIRRRLEEVLQVEERATSFLRGGITFCALKPMRSIPFAVIALLGLESGAFPRLASPSGFDLMAARPRLGDRDLRADDRYLFLEMLLAAGRRLHLSHVARSQVDDAEREPSVCVDELLEHLEQRCPGRRESVLRDHRLQPWSPAYFSAGTGLFSYDRIGAAVAGGQGDGTPPLIADDFPGPADLPNDSSPAVIALEDLVRGVVDPVTRWCRAVLDCDLGDESEVDEDLECFHSDHLDDYLVRDWLFHRPGGAADPAILARQGRQQGLLPHGVPGELVVRERLKEVATLNRFLADRQLDVATLDALPDVPVRVEVDGTVIQGHLAAVAGSGLVLCRVGKIRPQDLLSTWVRFLALAVADIVPASQRQQALLVGIDGSKILRAPADPIAILAPLVRLYRAAGETCLPITPAGSHAWAVAALADAEDPTGAARGKVALDRTSRAGRIAFRDRDPLESPHFGPWALALWTPVLAALEDPS